MKADCAPLSTLGDGRVSLADYVQTGRFAANLDAVRPAGGPDRPAPSLTTADLTTGLRASIQGRHGLPESARSVLLRQTPTRNGELTFSIELRGEGDENAIAFSLEFPDSMKLISATADDGNADLHLNNTTGRLGVLLAMPPGLSFSGRRLLTLRFSGKGEVRFADRPLSGEVVTVDADTVPTIFSTPAPAFRVKR